MNEWYCFLHTREPIPKEKANYLMISDRGSHIQMIHIDLPK